MPNRTPALAALAAWTILASCALASAAAGQEVSVASHDKAAGSNHIVTVAPSGAMFKTVTAALASITNASSTNPYLISIAPGTYVGHVVMKPYVDLLGSGEAHTQLTAPGGATSPVAAVVRAAASSEIRSLTISTSGGASAVGIYAETGSPIWLKDVSVYASGGTFVTYGIYAQGTSAALDRVTVSVSSATGVVAGVELVGGNGVIDRSSIYVQGVLGFGLHKELIGFVIASDSTIYGPIGLHATANVVIDTRNVQITGNMIGFQCTGCLGTLDGTSISAASNGGPPHVGLECTQSAQVDIHQGRVYGTASSVSAGVGTQVRIGGASVAGGPAGGGGILKCAGVYDENFTFFGSSCP